MGATGRASQKKTQFTLRFTPSELTQLEHVKNKLNITSNNKLFIHLLYEYPKIVNRANREEKEKDRYKEELTELKSNSQKFLSSFEAFQTSANKEIEKLDIDRYNRY